MHAAPSLRPPPSPLPLLVAVAALALALSACCRDPWNAYPRSTPPDRSCITGSGAAGYDVYIWECVAGKHVVVAQYSAEMTCRSPVEEVSACGTKTPLETELALTPERCKGANRDWR